MCTGGIDLQHICKERMKRDSERMDAVSRTTNVDASVGSYGFLCLGISRTQGGRPHQDFPLGQGSWMSIAQFQLPALDRKMADKTAWPWVIIPLNSFHQFDSSVTSTHRPTYRSPLLELTNHSLNCVYFTLESLLLPHPSCACCRCSQCHF